MIRVRLALQRTLSVFRRGRLEHELTSEIEAHLEAATADYVARGIPRRAARQAALRDFGGITRTQEMHRDIRGLPVVEAGLRDVRFAIRALWHAPGFSSVAILTLGLGIGVNTAMFSVFDAVLVRPMPFPNSERLASLYVTSRNSSKGSVSYPNLLDWQQQAHTFEGIAGFRFDEFTYSSAGSPEMWSGGMVSANYFSTLGVSPVAGRGFLPGEDRLGGAPVVVIGEGIWRRFFGAYTSVVGRRITVDGVPRVVVGVFPAHAGIVGIDRQLHGDVFLPIGQYDDPLFRRRAVNDGTLAIGRLAHTATMSQARAEMDSIAAALAVAYPEENGGRGIRVIPLRQDLFGDAQPTVALLAGAVGFVLLIACANMANLLLARSESRAQEFALRASLGASRRRIAGQVLTESLILSLCGGTLGVILAASGTRAALTLLPSALPGLSDVRSDGRMLFFALGASIVSAVLFGLAPALRATRHNLSRGLSERGWTAKLKRRASNLFVIAEVALTFVLLVSAGLLIRSLANLWSVPPGFEPHGVLTFTVPLSREHSVDALAVRSAWKAINERLSALPGVTAASVELGAMPFTGSTSLGIWRDGEPRPQRGEVRNTIFYAVGPDYFTAMNIPLKTGRGFTIRDDASQPGVVIVDEELSRTFFPGLDPIGRRLRFTSFEGVFEIVGVAGHVKHWGLDADAEATVRSQLYMPYQQVPDGLAMLASKGLTGVVRSDLPAAGLVRSIRAAIASFDQGQAIHNERSMEDIVASSLARRRCSLILLSMFALTALFLSIVGVYGLVSYVAGQRTREFGIRMALGGQSRAILGDVLWQGAKLAATGIVIGVVSSLALTRLVADQLYGVEPGDLATFGLTALVFALITLPACYFPARRATHIEPLTALRCD